MQSFSVTSVKIAMMLTTIFLELHVHYFYRSFSRPRNLTLSKVLETSLYRVMQIVFDILNRFRRGSRCRGWTDGETDEQAEPLLEIAR